MTQTSSYKPTTSVLRFTRTMGAPLRREYAVDPDESVDEFTELLEQADRRRGAQETPSAD